MKFTLPAILLFTFTNGFALASGVGLASHGHRSPPRSPGFPRVYSAIVPLHPDENGIVFASQVDLLDTMATYDSHIKISFLVHDENELEFITNLQPASLKVQPKLTEELQYQQNYDDKNRYSRLQTYDAIPGFSCYKSVRGTFDWMDDMVARASSIPNLSVTIADIGDSYLKTQDASNGSDILAMKITGNTSSATTTTSEKGVFFAMSGIHAREYAPVELASRWAETLIDAYGKDADITSLLDHTEIHLVFQSNPDGRQVAETNRIQMRRKNLNPNGKSAFPCAGGSYGVDLNRNFPFRWGRDDGSSNFKCSSTYRGPSPASEPEVRAIVEYCESIFPEGQRKADPDGQSQEPYDEATTKGVFFDIHAYGELIIWPWSHENSETGNDSGFEALANKYRHFNGYDYSGPSNGFLYEASGATDDWAYGTLGAAGMTFELGTDFYQDCEYFEESILPGNLNALTYAAKTSMAPYSLSKGPDVTSISASVVGDSLTVTATASDDEWSSSNHPTSQQGVAEIRVFVNEHPSEGQSGTVLTGTSLTIDISGLPDGSRHVAYVQATDGEGYKGPVTAAYFTKGDGGGSNPSLPIISPTSSPASPAAASSAPGVHSPTAPALSPPPPAAPEPCTDGRDPFYVAMIEANKDCQWLGVNTVRFSYLCDFLEVAAACPKTCDRCGYFS